MTKSRSDRLKIFEGIDFESFRAFAKDDSLSKYERIGFPDHYRRGREEEIFREISEKLRLHGKKGKTILDIGPGCSDLPVMLINLCRENDHSLTLVDSAEMLAHLPNDTFIRKVDAFFPNCPDAILELQGRVDVILCYSVLHYVIVDTSLFRFLDKALSLLSHGGLFLIGDIPNISKRKRFFSADAGIKFHKEFMKTTDPPIVSFNKIEHDQIDDAMVMAIMQRARAQGFDAYVLPQDGALPMANRREDILIARP